MEVNRLLGDELSYELYIRGLPTEGNVCDKRSVLRGALRCEKSGYVTLPNIGNLDPERELTICDNKLIELSDEVNKFDIQNRHNDYKRINSRLVHITSRIGRITCNDLQRDIQSRLQARCMQVIDLLNEVYENSLNFEIVHLPEGHGANSILDEPNCLLPEISRDRLTSQHANALIDLGDAFENQNNVSCQSNGNNCTNSRVEGRDTRVSFAKESYARGDQEDMINGSLGSHPIDNFSKLCNFGNSTVDLDTRFRKLSFSPLMGGNNNHLRLPHSSTTNFSDTFRHFEVNRLNLKFDGRTSVTSFIERVEEIRCSRGIPKEQIFRSVPEIFVGEALHWFRVNRFDSWDDLIGQLKEQFLPYDYDDKIRKEIERRTQGGKEKVVTYVVAMENLYNKLLDKPLEEVRVRKIKRGLRPYIYSRIVLHPTPSIKELVRVARIIEETELQEELFQPPPKNYDQLMEPDLAYRGLSLSRSSRSEALQDVFKDVRGKLKAAYERSRKYYNLRHRDERFQLRQEVWRRNYVISDASKNFTAKLAPKFTGPLTVIDILSPWSYRLADNTGKDCGVWHARDLKSHPPDEGSCPSFVGAWCELSPPEACERDVA
ncbi:hypothetical protein NQ314_019384 [Rhamnusium bicolor]|uniref:Retrotransposon gag domain-containing protein n=1 Tax=Rhamnusium bicolor TaxID=1586634 RepID=A0AAV8WPK2_9CUCU|nr:hypothetical protein NQ314_019384 [Rhamnusium bicolor]